MMVFIGPVILIEILYASVRYLNVLWSREHQALNLRLRTGNDMY